VYGRSAESDLWLTSPLLSNSKSLMKKFKHMVYSFALHRRYKHCKALYLYRNRERLAKAELIQPTASENVTLIISFESVDVLKAFDEAEEQLIDFDHTFMERVFKNRFGVPVRDSDSDSDNKFVFKSNNQVRGTK
jgi:hypothetical protein